MFDGAGETIELPDQDNVEPALAGVVHQGLELRPLALGSTDAVVDILAVASKSPTGKATQVVQLHLAVLVSRADSGVQGHGLLLSRVHPFSHVAAPVAAPVGQRSL